MPVRDLATQRQHPDPGHLRHREVLTRASATIVRTSGAHAQAGWDPAIEVKHLPSRDRREPWHAHPETSHAVLSRPVGVGKVHHTE